jgi:hypothetical protein
MRNRTLWNTILSLFLTFACGLPLMSCTSTPKLSSSAMPEQSRRAYWKAVAHPDGRYFILPRPELSTDYPTPDAINNLTYAEATTMVTRLNGALQFNVSVSIENDESVVRITPDPHLEDVLEICRLYPNEAVIQGRCQKELKWAAGKARPDIYLRYTACEAAFFAKQLNHMYGRPQPKITLCAP